MLLDDVPQRLVQGWWRDRAVADQFARRLREPEQERHDVYAGHDQEEPEDAVPAEVLCQEATCDRGHAGRDDTRDGCDADIAAALGRGHDVGDDGLLQGHKPAGARGLDAP